MRASAVEKSVGKPAGKPDRFALSRPTFFVVDRLGLFTCSSESSASLNVFFFHYRLSSWRLQPSKQSPDLDESCYARPADLNIPPIRAITFPFRECPPATTQHPG